MMKQAAFRYPVAIAMILSWMIVAAAPWLAALIPWRSDYEPRLPNVAVVPWDSTSDFMSTVPGLFKVLLFAGLGALAVEVPKALLRSAIWPTYLLLILYQLILMADALRAYAYDWWVWLAFWLGLRSTGIELGFQTSLPWVSLLVMIAMTWYLWRQPWGEAPDM